MPNKLRWTLRAVDEHGVLLLSRDAELDPDALDDATLELHVARFLTFLKVGGGVDRPARIQHEVDAPAEVRDRLAAAVERTRRE